MAPELAESEVQRSETTFHSQVADRGLFGIASDVEAVYKNRVQIHVCPDISRIRVGDVIEGFSVA